MYKLGYQIVQKNLTSKKEYVASTNISTEPIKLIGNSFSSNIDMYISDTELIFTKDSNENFKLNLLK